MAVNDDLFDLTVRSAVYFDQIANEEVAQIIKLIDRKMRPEIRRQLDRELAALVRSPSPFALKRYTKLLLSMDAIVDSGMAEIGKTLAQRMDLVAKVVMAQTGAHLAQAIPLNIRFNMPAPALLREIVRSRPFEGALLKDWFVGLKQSSKRELRRQLTTGLANGESIPRITRRIMGDPGAASAFSGPGAIKKIRRNVQAVTRTAVNHIANGAREATFQENSEVIGKLRWTSTLDARTSDICQSLDGQEFKLTEGPRPPAHFSCRSIMTPITKSWKELGINAGDFRIEGRQIRDVQTGLSGYSPGKMNYGQWLRKQPREVQVMVLGETRTRLLRGNRVGFDRFFSDGRRLTLTELAQREGIKIPSL